MDPNILHNKIIASDPALKLAEEKTRFKAAMAKRTADLDKEGLQWFEFHNVDDPGDAVTINYLGRNFHLVPGKPIQVPPSVAAQVSSIRVPEVKHKKTAHGQLEMDVESQTMRPRYVLSPTTAGASPQETSIAETKANAMRLTSFQNQFPEAALKLKAAGYKGLTSETYEALKIQNADPLNQGQ